MLAIAGQMTESNGQTFFEVTLLYPRATEDKNSFFFFKIYLTLKIPRAMQELQLVSCLSTLNFTNVLSVN